MYENAKTDLKCSAKVCLMKTRDIKKGSRIYHSDKLNKDMHEPCAVATFTKSKTNANPTSKPSDKAEESHSDEANVTIKDPKPLEDKERIDMIEKARREVKELFGLDETASEYAGYVQMCYNGLLQQQNQIFSLGMSRRIQALEEKKMKAWGKA